MDKKAGLNQAFRTADDVLRQGIQGISELITIPGLDQPGLCRRALDHGGRRPGPDGDRSRHRRRTGHARPPSAPSTAPCSTCRIDGARSIIFNIRGGDEMSLFEVNEAAEVVRANTHPEANIIFGAVIDPAMKDDLQLTVIATGFERTRSSRIRWTSARASFEARPAPLRRASSPSEATKPASDYLVRTFDRDDLDIPAFLRRSRQNGK